MKFNIKSKKQKMQEKKLSKGNIPSLIDLVQSSSEQLYSENIQKKSKHSGKFINSHLQQQSQSNTINLDRIKQAVVDNKKLAEKIVQNVFKNDNNNDENLFVVENKDVQQQTSQERSLFSYRVQGKQGIKYISQSHFKGRINSEIRNLEAKSLKKVLEDEIEFQKIMQGQYPNSDDENKQKQTKQQKKQKQAVPERKRAARYFEQENSNDDEQATNIVKCFRCNKKGHIAKHCFEQVQKIRCNFCLGQHHHSVCDSSPCFKCCQLGHISQDCNSKSIQCKKCRKRGHKSQNCGIFMYLDYHNRTDEQIKKIFTMSDLRNLKCFNYCQKPSGHFNCFNYKNNKHLPPYMDRIERNNYYERDRKYNSYSQNYRR